MNYSPRSKSRSSLRPALILVGSIAALLGSHSAKAADYYWDTDGTATTAGLGNVAGTWGTSLFEATVNNPGTTTGITAGANTTTTITDTMSFGIAGMALGTTASNVTVGTISIGSIIFGAGQTNAVTLSGGTLTLAAAGTITVNNTTDTISTVIGSGGAGTSLTKGGAGTLILSGANLYTGATIVTGGGALQIGNGTNGSLNGTTGTALTFNAGGGIFNLAKASGGSQNMLALNFSAGDGTVTSTAASGAATQTLTFASLAARTAGATGNFNLATNTTATQNKIVLTSTTNAPVSGTGSNNAGYFFGGTEYARYDTTAGYFRATNYAASGGDTNAPALVSGSTIGTAIAATDVKLSGNITAQTTASVNTLNLGANSLTLSDTAQILSVNGILSAASGSAQIATAGKIQGTAAGNELVIRVNGSSDVLSVAPIIQNFNAGATASALTKSGAGTLILSGANTYTGTTTINGGTLALSGGSAITDAAGFGAVVLANSAGATLRLDSSETIGTLSGGGFSGGNVNVQGNTLTFSNSGAQSFGGTFSGTSAGAIIKNGAGTFTMSNKNSFLGTLTINAGTVDLSYANDGTSSPQTLSSGGTISIGNTASLGFYAQANINNGTYSGQFSSPNARTLSNAITVQAGATATLRFGGVTASPNSANGVRWDLTGPITGASSGSGNQTLNVYMGYGAGMVSGDNAVINLSGAIQDGSVGNLGVTVDFVNIQTPANSQFVNLSGLNTFTGALRVDNTKAGTGGYYLTIGGLRTATGSVTAGTGALGWNGTSGNYSGSITLATSTILDYASSQAQTLGGAITGTGALQKNGTGTLTLSSTSNSYTGTTTINAGTLAVSGGFAIANTGAVVLANTAGANFQLNSNETIGNLSGGGTTGGNVNLQANTLTLGDTGTQTFAGVLSGTNGSLTKQGTGTLTLSNTNTFTGATTVSAGVLKITPTTALSGTSGITVASGATLELNSPGSATYTNALTLSGTGASGSGGALVLSIASGTPTSSYAGAITLAGDTTTNAPSGMTLSFTGSINLNSYTLTTNFAHVRQDFVANSAAISGTGGLTVAGSGGSGGLWYLSGASTYTGATSITGYGLGLTGSLTGSSSITTSNAAIFNASGTINGATTLNQGSTGTSTLSGANTFTGATKVTNGILTLSNSLALQNSAFDTLNSATGGTAVGLKTALATLTFGGLTGNKDLASVFTTTAGGYSGVTTLTLNPGNGVTNSYSGVIANGAANMILAKTGLGTQILGASSTYTGATTISAGTLALGNLGNLLGSSTVGSAVGVTGTLAVAQTGNGTANAIGQAGQTTAASLTLNAGGTLNMGDGFTSTLNVIGAGTLSSGAGAATTLTFNLGASTNDLLAISGAGTNSNSTNRTVINLTGLVAPSASSNLYTIITAGSGLTPSNFTIGGSTNYNIGGTIYHFALDGSSSPTQEVVSLATGAATPASAYWTGSQGNGSWTSQDGTTFATNFANNAAGTLDTYAASNLFTSATTVFMTANSAANLATTLDQASTSIAGLVFTGTSTSNTAGSSIAPGATSTNSLTIGTGGITVQAGSGANTISAPAILGGAQSWTNNSGNLLSVSGNIDNGANLLTVGGSGNTTISGSLGSGTTKSGGLTVNASGATVNLTAVNGYTGNTTISAGTLRISGTGSLGASASYAGTIAIANAGTLQYSSSANQTLTAAISGAGALTKDTNTGNTLTLTNASTSYTGAVTVNAGTLRLTKANFSASTPAIAVNATGILALDGANWTLAPGINLNGGTLLFDENGGYAIVNKVVNVTLDSTLKTSGTGNTSYNSQLFLDNGGLNISSGKTLTYNPLTVNSGIVLRSNASSSGSLVISGVGTTSLTGRANLQFNTTGATNFANTDLTLTNATMNIGVGTNAGDTNSAGATVKSLNGNGKVWADGTSNTLTVGANNGTGSFSGVLANGNATLSLTKTGSGTQTLSGNNTYTGLTTVSAGALNIGSAGSLNSGSALTVGASGTADFANAGQTLGAVDNANTSTNALNFSNSSGNITLGSLTGGGNTRFGGNGTVTGGIATGTVNAVGLLTSNISSGTVGAGTLSSTTISGGAVTVTGLASVSGTLSGSGTLGAGSLSAGTVSGGTNTIATTAGITTLSGGNTTVGGVATIGTMSSGIANLNGATSLITLLNGGTVNLGGSTVLSVGGGTTSGSITGTGGGLTKTTGSTLTLSGTNTYTGGTSVTAGQLRVTGSLANTAVTVSNSNTTLSGTGGIAGLTTIGANAILAPGLNSTGTLNNYGNVSTTLSFSGGLTITSSALLNFDSGDTVQVTGGVFTVGNGTLTLDNGIALSAPGTYTLFNYSGATFAGSASNLSLSNTLTGLNSTFSLSGNSLILTLASLATNSVITVDGSTSALATTSLVTLGTGGRVLAGGAALTGSATLTKSNSDATTYTLTNGSGATNSGFSLSFAGGNLTESGTVGLDAGTLATVGVKSSTVTVTNTGTGVTDAADTITIATTVVAARTLTSATTLDLGNVHVGKTVSISSNATGNTYGTGGTGAHTDTENATVAAYTGQPAQNGITLTTGATTLNTNTGVSGLLAGTISGSGAVSGNYTLGVTRELSGAQSGVTVGYTANVYSGTGVWNTNGSGSYGTLSSMSNWTTAGGAPGLDSSFASSDSATFDNALSSGTATVSLNGANPSLAAVTFNNAAGSYDLAAGSGGSVTLNGGGSNATLTNSAGTHTVSAPVVLASNLDVSTAPSTVLNVSGNISETGSARSLSKSGDGTLVLAGTNTYTGGTYLNGGTLDVSGSLTGAVAVASGTTLTSASGVTLSGNTTFSGTSSYSGNITAPSGIIVSNGANVAGVGALTGSATTYGILKVSGSVSGNVDVQSGGTLAGTGSAGSISVQSGGTLSPGNSPGLFTADSASFSNSGNATYKVEIDTTAAGSGATSLISGNRYDQTALTGNGTVLSLGTGSILDLRILNSALNGSSIASAGTPYNPSAANTGFDNYFIFDLQNTAALSTGTFANVTLNGTSFVSIDYSSSSRFKGINGIGTFTLGGQEYAISYRGDFATNSTFTPTGNDVVLTAIPEPGSLASLLGGLGVLVALQRRRRN